jgi:urocanate hydratase
MVGVEMHNDFPGFIHPAFIRPCAAGGPRPFRWAAPSPQSAATSRLRTILVLRAVSRERNASAVGFAWRARRVRFSGTAGKNLLSLDMAKRARFGGADQ